MTFCEKLFSLNVINFLLITQYNFNYNNFYRSNILMKNFTKKILTLSLSIIILFSIIPSNLSFKSGNNLYQTSTYDAIPHNNQND